MDFLIIGGAGFIGSWLTRNLIDKGHEVFVSDVGSNYLNANNDILAFRKHLSEGSKIIQTHDEVLKYNFDVIINLAAHAIEMPVADKISFFQLRNDIEATLWLVSYKKDTKLVFMSSSAVYGGYEYVATEYTQPNPQSVYGISKLTSELLIKTQLKNWNIVRSNSVYGFGDAGARASHIFVEKAFKNEKAWVNSAVWCDFIYVKDLVEGIAQVAINANSGETFNISGGKPYKLISYVEEINKHLPIEYELKSVNDRPKRGVLDNTKAKMLLHWSPKFDLEAGVKDMMNYIKQYGFM